MPPPLFNPFLTHLSKHDWHICPVFMSISFASTAKIVTRVDKALSTISKWIVKISTPAAAVAIGSGLLMKKFSFGDEERIRLGKKVIRGSLFSYAFILAIDLILSTIQVLVA